MSARDHILFGTIGDVAEPVLSYNGFTFRPATISLSQSNDGHAAHVQSLAEYAGSRGELIAAELDHDAPWARGRIEHLFQTRQNRQLTMGDTITSDGKYSDRICMHFSFAGGAKLNGLELLIPFVCTEGFGRSSLRFGTIPVRNATKYESLIYQLTNAFWELLLKEPASVNEYIDTGSYFETMFEFGIQSGRPFFHWPASHDDRQITTP